MFKQPLVRQSKKQYQLLWIISLAFVAIIFLLQLPNTHLIVDLFRYWETISLFILLLHPYTILKTICQESYTFFLPFSKKQLLINELKIWLIAAAIYLVTMYGLSISVEFIHSARPTIQESFMRIQLYLYSYMTFLVGILVLQAMAALIIHLVFKVNHHLLMGIIIIYNFFSLLLGLFCGFIGISQEMFLLIYAVISCGLSLYCFKFIERVNQ